MLCRGFHCGYCGTVSFPPGPWSQAAGAPPIPWTLPQDQWVSLAPSGTQPESVSQRQLTGCCSAWDPPLPEPPSVLNAGQGFSTNTSRGFPACCCGTIEFPPEPWSQATGAPPNPSATPMGSLAVPCPLLDTARVCEPGSGWRAAALPKILLFGSLPEFLMLGWASLLMASRGFPCRQCRTVDFPPGPRSSLTGAPTCHHPLAPSHWVSLAPSGLQQGCVC